MVFDVICIIAYSHLRFKTYMLHTSSILKRSETFF